MNDVQIVAELAVAVTVAVTVIRFWRQILAFVIAVGIGLCLIGLMTVIDWVAAVSQR